MTLSHISAPLLDHPAISNKAIYLKFGAQQDHGKYYSMKDKLCHGPLSEVGNEPSASATY